ncbi:MAG TPA: hypothetical protein VD970_09130 [Acetobacteraceae bacterium]|nr:hypothetical protein [Acetobacteraceae bacterium]
MSGDDTIAIIAAPEYQADARRAEKRGTPMLLAAPDARFTPVEDGAQAAGLSAVAAGGIEDFIDLAVRAPNRPNGLAQRILHAGAAWHFAKVAETNAASRAHRTGPGMWEAYQYRHFVPAEAKAQGLLSG